MDDITTLVFSRWRSRISQSHLHIRNIDIVTGSRRRALNVHSLQTLLGASDVVPAQVADFECTGITVSCPSLEVDALRDIQCEFSVVERPVLEGDAFNISETASAYQKSCISL